MSQWSTAQHCHIGTPFCTIRKSHVNWNFAVPVPHSEEIRRCTLLFLCTLGITDRRNVTDSWNCSMDGMLNTRPIGMQGSDCAPCLTELLCGCWCDCGAGTKKRAKQWWGGRAGRETFSIFNSQSQQKDQMVLSIYLYPLSWWQLSLLSTTENWALFVRRTFNFFFTYLFILKKEHGAF